LPAPTALRADLAAWKQRAAAERETAGNMMTHWLTDPNLAGVRDPAEQAKLPPDEWAE
jgi:hypothetical protein